MRKKCTNNFILTFYKRFITLNIVAETYLMHNKSVKVVDSAKMHHFSDKMTKKAYLLISLVKEHFTVKYKPFRVN